MKLVRKDSWMRCRRASIKTVSPPNIPSTLRMIVDWSSASIASGSSPWARERNEEALTGPTHAFRIKARANITDAEDIGGLKGTIR